MYMTKVGESLLYVDLVRLTMRICVVSPPVNATNFDATSLSLLHILATRTHFGWNCLIFNLIQLASPRVLFPSL